MLHKDQLKRDEVFTCVGEMQQMCIKIPRLQIGEIATYVGTYVKYELSNLVNYQILS